MKSGLAGEFVGRLLPEPIDGNLWRLKQITGEEFGLYVYGLGLIRPENGFYTDFASIPVPARWIYPKTGGGSDDTKYGQPAVIHDDLYSHPNIACRDVSTGQPIPVSRDLADRIFLLGMELNNVRYSLRVVFYECVHLFGKNLFGRPDKLNKLRGKT